MSGSPPLTLDWNEPLTATPDNQNLMRWARATHGIGGGNANPRSSPLIRSAKISVDKRLALTAQVNRECTPMRISAEDHPRPQVRPLTVAQSTQPAGDLGRRKRRPSVNGFANGAGGDAGGGAIYSADESLTLIDVEFRSNIAHAEGTRFIPFPVSRCFQWMHFLAHDLALALALTQRAMNHSKIYFDHEKLFAYQRSIEFVAWASQLLEELPPKLAVCDQLDHFTGSVRRGNSPV